MSESNINEYKGSSSIDSCLSINVLHQSLLRPFYGFNHPKTKWILMLLYSLPSSHKRLQTNQDTLRSYFEIPDIGQLPLQNLTKRDEHHLNRPAFHSLASLYLNPLGIAIYTRNEQALRFLLELKVYNFSDPCFIQRWWNKGKDTFFTDFSAVHIVALALRRNFFKSISLIMESGFDPRERLYQVDHIQSSDQSKTHVFQDCLDQAFHIVNERPCLNVGNFFKIISNDKFKNRYDPIIFEMQTVFINPNVKVNKICSLFRLVLQYTHLHLNGSCASTYLTILEVIQQNGFFKFISKEINNLNIEKQTLNHDEVCEGNFPQSNETEIQRLNKFDISKLPSEERKQYLITDRNICLGILFLWFSDIKGRQNQKYRLTKIIVHILLDCDLIIWFLKTSGKNIIKIISSKCCGIDNITVNGIGLIKNTIVEFLRYREILRKKIFKENDETLRSIFKKNKRESKVTKKLKQKKVTPYLIIDSQTMYSWHMSKKMNTLSKDFPMFSVHHKMGQMIEASTDKSYKIKSVTLENDDDTLREENNILSISSNSLHSFKEHNSISQTSDNPPPLIIRKFISKSQKFPEIIDN